MSVSNGRPSVGSCSNTYDPGPSGLATFASLAASTASVDGDGGRSSSLGDESVERWERFNHVYGVRDDCLALLQLFEAKDSMRFQDFAACWRDMMFSHMLSGRPNPAERVEYVQMFLKVIVKLFASGKDIIRKVGALYLLYGVFMKLGQGERTLVHIRVTPHVWMELKRFRRQVKEENHHDALYVVDRLFQSGAFMFVAHENEMAPDLMYRSAKGDLDGGSEDEEEDEDNPLLEYLEDGGLQQLSTLHNKYEAIKREVFKGASDRRLITLGPDLVPTISSRLEAAARGRPAGVPPSSDRPTQSATLTARQQVRARASARFREAPVQSRVDEQRSAAEADDPSSSPRRGRGSRGGGRGSRGSARGQGRGRGRSRGRGRTPS